MGHFAEILDIRISKVRRDFFKLGTNDSDSAICKESVESAELGELGFLGDEVAESAFHGGANKAVLLFSLESYREISELCGISVEALKSASFGENLLLSGACERDICVGDVLEIGDARLEISQPRQPCWKLSLNHGTRTLALKLYESGLSGFYARVLRGGSVQRGGVSLVSRPFPKLTIFALNSLIQNPAIDESFAREVLSCPLLSPNFHTSLKSRLEGKISSPPEYIHAPN